MDVWLDYVTVQGPPLVSNILIYRIISSGCLFYYLVILLFYYLVILLFYYLVILLFSYFIILLFSYFTIFIFSIRDTQYNYIIKSIKN